MQTQGSTPRRSRRALSLAAAASLFCLSGVVVGGSPAWADDPAPTPEPVASSTSEPCHCYDNEIQTAATLLAQAAPPADQSNPEITPGAPGTGTTPTGPQAGAPG